MTESDYFLSFLDSFLRSSNVLIPEERVPRTVVVITSVQLAVRQRGAS